ncbi:hypothetical protein D3C84_953910 [compost metagenome]
MVVLRDIRKAVRSDVACSRCIRHLRSVHRTECTVLRDALDGIRQWIAVYVRAAKRNCVRRILRNRQLLRICDRHVVDRRNRNGNLRRCTGFESVLSNERKRICTAVISIRRIRYVFAIHSPQCSVLR